MRIATVHTQIEAIQS